jgi:hypothetical protein
MFAIVKAEPSESPSVKRERRHFLSQPSVFQLRTFAASLFDCGFQGRAWLFRELKGTRK